MKGRNSIKFSILWDLVIGFISSTILITAFVSRDKFIEFEWIGCAIILSIIYAWIKWFKNEIDYLKEEINKLKENAYRKKITK